MVGVLVLLARGGHQNNGLITLEAVGVNRIDISIFGPEQAIEANPFVSQSKLKLAAIPYQATFRDNVLICSDYST